MNTPVSDNIRKRIAVVIFIAQSFFSASTIAAFTLSPIIAVALSGSETSAGFPQTIGLVGRAAFAYPFAFLMDRIGRRLSLSGGYGLAVIGAIVSAFGVLNSSFFIFMVGALLIGMSRVASDQSRYVVAEVYPFASRPKVIGWIVFAGTIGAIFGPRLVPLSGRLVEQFSGLETAMSEYIGPFLVASIAMAIGSLITFFFLRPDPLEISKLVAAEEAAEDEDSLENQSGSRSLPEIFSKPLARLAVVSMILGYFVMSFMMVITPLYMGQNGHSNSNIAWVIMGHTLGMFGVSGITGSLIGRFGRVRMIYAGGTILMLAAIIAPTSTNFWVHVVALFLLGLGWNFAYVSGSSLLSDALSHSERARGQAASETAVALTTALASFSVGYVYKIGTFNLVAGIGLTLAVTLLVATFILSRQASAKIA